MSLAGHQSHRLDDGAKRKPLALSGMFDYVPRVHCGDVEPMHSAKGFVATEKVYFAANPLLDDLRDFVDGQSFRIRHFRRHFQQTHCNPSRTLGRVVAANTRRLKAQHRLKVWHYSSANMTLAHQHNYCVPQRNSCSSCTGTPSRENSASTLVDLNQHRWAALNFERRAA